MNLSVDSFGAGAGGFVPPNPGGAQASGAAAAESAVAGQCTPTGSNPLVAAANPLLNLVPQIRSTVHHPNPAWLREHRIPVYRQSIAGIRRRGQHLEAVQLKNGATIAVEALFTTRGDIYFNKLAKGLGA